MKNKEPSGIVIWVKLLSIQAKVNFPASKNTCGVPKTDEFKPGTEGFIFLMVRNFRTSGFQLTEYWTAIRSEKLSTLKSMSIIWAGLASALLMLKIGCSALTRREANMAMMIPRMDLLISKYFILFKKNLILSKSGVNIVIVITISCTLTTKREKLVFRAMPELQCKNDNFLRTSQVIRTRIASGLLNRYNIYV